MDYKLSRGDTFKPAPTTVYQPAPNQCVPQDVTGWTFWFTVKRYVSDYDSMAVWQGTNLDLSGAVTIVQPTAGTIQLMMPALKTVGFPDLPTQILYDVQGKDPTGAIRTVDTGTIRVSPDVTRATS